LLLSFSEQSEEEGEKKTKKRKAVPEGHGEGSSSDEDSNSSSSSSDSAMTSESEEEQVASASWRKKVVRILAGPPDPPVPEPKYRSTAQPEQARGSPSSLPFPIFLFQSPSSKSTPAAKEISLLDLEDCEFVQ
jgi:hypothetical protein